MLKTQLMEVIDLNLSPSLNSQMEVTELPEKILHQVLLGRLTKLSQRRLRAVSKTWRDLIIKLEAASASSTTTSIRYLDSGFAGKEFFFDHHMTLYRRDNRGGLTRQDHFPLKSMRLPWIGSCNAVLSYCTEKSDYDFQILLWMGSCNGVLFYCTEKSDYPGVSVPRRYHVYNPLTHQISTLPHSEFTRERFDPDLIGLALDKKSSRSSSDHDYKLVALYRLLVSIFDSKMGGWKTNPAKFSHPRYHDRVEFRGLFLCGVYVNGIIYWLSKERQRPESLVIIAFFEEEEVFRVFMLPKRIECTDPKWAPAMWESEEGRLMYGQICEREGLCIWVLHHPRELGHEDQYHHCDIAGCCTSADHQNNGWKLILRVSPETLIAKLSTVIVINSFDQVERVSAFNEELYIVHIKTLKGYVSYNIPESTVSLLRDYYNKHDLMELSLRYGSNRIIG